MSTDPDSGDTAAAGTAGESTAVGSPKKVCGRAAERWSTDPERPNPAGTVWNCGSVPHHGGPSNEKRIYYTITSEPMQTLMFYLKKPIMNFLDVWLLD